jgi:cytochrome c553
VSDHPPPSGWSDRRWSIVAGLGVAGALAFSAIFGLVILPLAQAPGAGLTPWLAICRALGVAPGTPAQPQPPVSATAAPVSLVQWSPHTLQILASADQRPGAELAAAVCANCHGDQGLSISDDFPRLAGQSPEAIYKQLSDYRSGARVNPTMTLTAKTLTDDQLAQVANYFGHIPRAAGPVLGRANLEGGDAAMLNLINRGDPSRRLPPCQACHATGVGGPPEAPVINGQNAGYLERQLTAFRAGDRRNDVYRRMRDIAGLLTPDEITHVSKTYQGTY